MSIRIKTALLVALAFNLPACDSGAPGGPARPDGAAIYARHCASCHGARLEGQADWRTRKADGRLPAPPHDASGHTWHHPAEQLFAITKFGMVPPNAPPGYASDMPAFAGILGDDEIRAVLAYIEGQWPDDVKRMRAERFGSPGR